MNFEDLIIQLLQAIRGNYSQARLSEKLGYSYNKVYRWESLTTSITWDEFLQLTEVCGVSVLGAFRNIFNYESNSEQSKDLILFFAGDITHKEISKRINCSPSLFSRWMNGHSKPKLIDMLKIIYRASQLLPEFVYALIPSKEKVESIEKEIKKREAERNLCYEHPILMAFIRCLELREYEDLQKHQHGFISKKLGISISDEKIFIDKLLSFKLIENVKSKYKPTNKVMNMTADYGKNIDVIKYWLNRHNEILDLAKKNSAFSNGGFAGYLVISTTKETNQKVKELYTKFVNEMMQTILSDVNRGDIEHTMIFNANFSDLLSLTKV